MSQRFMIGVIGISILLLGLVVPAMAQEGTFRLVVPGSLHGVELKPGEYKVKVSTDSEMKAHVMRRGKLLVECPVEVRPRDSERANTVLQNDDGSLREVRLKNDVLIFNRAGA